MSWTNFYEQQKCIACIKNRVFMERRKSIKQDLCLLDTLGLVKRASRGAFFISPSFQSINQQMDWTKWMKLLSLKQQTTGRQVFPRFLQKSVFIVNELTFKCLYTLVSDHYAMFSSSLIKWLLIKQKISREKLQNL